MLSKINSAGLNGISGFTVSVEVDEAHGIPRYIVVGNVSSSVREGLERAMIALKNLGIQLPPRRITVNLSPADLRKEGTFFDLPILVGILRSLRLIPEFSLEKYAFFGEVGLNGSIRHVRGTLPLVMTLKKQGFCGAVVPEENVQEALNAEGMDIIGVASVKELKQLLSSQKHFKDFPRHQPRLTELGERYDVDFEDVRGQNFGIRAALISAAGGHNLLLSGTAGSGKTMIAKRIPTIMPPLSRAENIEISTIYSVCGLLPKGEALYNRRPFRMPHHTMTTAALTGGCGNGGVLPGELALASKGVLFMDELPLFSRATIEALRQPLEEKRIVLNRMKGAYVYPADCLYVFAMNPCACGFYPDRTRCTCTPSQIRSYRRSISRPILDRIDLCAEAAPLSYGEAADPRPSVSSAVLREQVVRAREKQKERFAELPDISTNAEMHIQELQRYCVLGAVEQEFMRQVFIRHGLSMRGYHKLLRVARTIADLEEADEISVSHLAEALAYRGLKEVSI